MKNNIYDFQEWLMSLAKEIAKKQIDIKKLEKNFPEDAQIRYEGFVADAALGEGAKAQDVLEAAIAKIAIDNHNSLVGYHEGMRLSLILEQKLNRSTASRSGLQYEIQDMIDYVIPMLLGAGFTDEEIWKMAEDGWSKFRKASSIAKNTL
jgi:hypothetical protein